MAITTQFLTGFEHGFLTVTTSAAGGGLFDTTTGTGFTASTTTPANGTYCAHLVKPANAQHRRNKNVTGSPTKVVSRFKLKVSSRPSSGTPTVFGIVIALGFSYLRVDQNGQLTFQCGGGSTSTGPTIDTTSWHLIEFQIDSSTNPWTLDWKVDGVSQTQATWGVGSDFVTGLMLGEDSTVTAAYTADYDDFIFGSFTVAGTDWYGDGKILAQLAGVDGTHATITSLSPGDAGTAYAGTPTNVNTMVDDAPTAGASGAWSATRSTTDNVALRTATVGAYASIGPATTSETGVANAVRALLSYSSSTATANLAACDVRNSAGAVTAIHGTTGGTGADFSESTNFFKGAMVTTPAGGWTASEVNAVRWRFGGCTSADISPPPTVQGLMLEVDWPVVPVAIGDITAPVTAPPTPA